MSRFFRSPDSTSSSDAESASDEDGDENVRDLDLPDTQSPSATNTAIGLHSSGSASIDRQSTETYATHRDFLLHALLEERCTNEVLAAYDHVKHTRRPQRNSPEVQSQARARYQRLCAQLASLDLISTGLEVDQHATTRQRYREGLDVLSQQRGNTAAAVPPRLRRLLTDPEGTVRQDSDRNAGTSLLPETATSALPSLPFPLRRLLTDAGNQNDSAMHAATAGVSNLHPVAAGMQASRYFQEFEELSILGRGGYGVVYHVRHRLDNQFYAVKKVPLSKARLQRIQHRGRSEVDEVLRELRTLARLDHPNIVRYYNGWVEWADRTAATGMLRSTGQDDLSAGASGDAMLGAANDSSFETLRTVITEEDTGTEILFEDSQRPTDITSSPAIPCSEANGSRPQSVIAEVSNEESARQLSPQLNEPTLTLHMQMGIHPMTVADFLAPAPPSATDSSTTAPPLSHCFHIEPSIAILQALLDGIEYLHNEGIAHRDIKPSNIFLGRKADPRSTRGSVDLMLCGQCRAQGLAAPIRLEVRIGDFGLVSVADPDERTENGKLDAVGTEMYRPASSDAGNGWTLDIYALGIVAFELLWKFDTRMERVHTLQRLKRGEFPDRFERVHGGQVVKCIRAMLADDGHPVPVAEIRRMLSVIA